MNMNDNKTPKAKKTSRKPQVKMRDLKAKKNPKGGLNFTKITYNTAGSRDA